MYIKIIAFVFASQLSLGIIIAYSLKKLIQNRAFKSPLLFFNFASILLYISDIVKDIPNVLYILTMLKIDIDYVAYYFKNNK